MTNDFLKMQNIFKKDLTECILRLNESGTQSEWRTFIRTLFASIEGICHQFKMTILIHVHEGNLELDVDKKLFLVGKRAVEKSDDIELEDRYYPTNKTIKQTLKLYEKLTGEENLVDFSNHGWEDLQKAIKIRNRLTHPKKSDDLIIKEKEFDTLLNGNKWWLKSVAYLSAGYYKKMTDSNFDVKERINEDHHERIKELSQEV